MCLIGTACGLCQQGLCICRASVRPSVCLSVCLSLHGLAQQQSGRICAPCACDRLYGLITLQATRGVVRFLHKDEALLPLSRSRSRSSVTTGVVVRERGGTPFPQIFCCRNGDPANIVGYRWNANTHGNRSGKSRRTR